MSARRDEWGWLTYPLWNWITKAVSPLTWWLYKRGIKGPYFFFESVAYGEWTRWDMKRGEGKP